MSLLTDFKAARRCSTPLIAVSTPDPAATIAALAGVSRINGDDAAPVLVQWDCVRGLQPVRDDEASKAVIAELVGSDGFDQTKNNPTGAVVLAARLPACAVLFLHLAHRWMTPHPCPAGAAFVQAVWNLRDRFKNDHRTLVLLGPLLILPPEIAGDVVSFDEPLPDGPQLGTIIVAAHAAAGLDCDTETLTKAVEAVQGLPAFQAEQVTAMSLSKAGLKLDALWERKRRQIEQTPGLKVYRGGERFRDIGGCEVVKGFLGRLLRGSGSGSGSGSNGVMEYGSNGKGKEDSTTPSLHHSNTPILHHSDAQRPSAIVFIDEIEKMLGGARGDTSGVSQDQLGSLLAYMQDTAAAGMIFIGPPGAAKSAVAKAAGNEAGIPTIQLDLGGAKGSLVGQSEGQLRAALKVITSVSNGRSLWIATCNSIGDLPPELRRRFTLGTFFFDLPTAEERAAIWRIYTARYALVEGGGLRVEGKTKRSGRSSDPQPSTLNPQPSTLNPPPLPADEGWTGAEIRQCCDIAWRLGCTLRDAAEFVVPVSRSAADVIGRLREQASGRFLSASTPGVYRHDKEQTTPTANGSRRIALED